MLVVAVVVSVSIKITKVKLDNIISYTYYSGYSTLRSVCGQILSDFKTNDNEYLEANNSWFNKLFSNPAYSKTVYGQYPPSELKANNLGSFFVNFDTVTSSSNSSRNYETLDEMYKNCSENPEQCWGMGHGNKYKKCTGKFNYYDGYDVSLYTDRARLYHCIKENGKEYIKLYENLGTYDDVECNQPCTNYPAMESNVAHNCGKYIAGDKTTGYYYFSSFENSEGQPAIGIRQEVLENYTCEKVPSKLVQSPDINVCVGFGNLPAPMYVCKPKSGNIYPPYVISEEDDEPSNVCTTPSEAEQQTHRCQNQEEWNQATCKYVPITCTEGNHWSVNSCGCVPESPTLPRKGINFCKKFVSYTNTKSNSPECTGSSISSTDTDFSNKTADITLRNGMRIYNMSQTPQEIGILEGNTQGSSYDGVPNINTFGYTVYLDIDGEKGSSTLWEDVYKFYITMAGKVIPAYDENHPNEEVGGNSKRHLMTSVEKEAIVDGRRQMRWLKKSVTFKEGACTSNYLGSSSKYCNGVNLLPDCNDPINPCFMKHISPVKFF